MKYINAAEVLPKELLAQIQKHISGGILYIPLEEKRMGWGEKNGSKEFFSARNEKIRELYKEGRSIEELSEQFGLAYDTVRKIVYNRAGKSKISPRSGGS